LRGEPLEARTLLAGLTADPGLWSTHVAWPQDSQAVAAADAQYDSVVTPLWEAYNAAVAAADEAYLVAMQGAEEAYTTAVASADQAFDATVTPAEAALQAVLDAADAAFWATVEPAHAAYQQAAAAAQAAYDQALAPALDEHAAAVAAAHAAYDAARAAAQAALDEACADPENTEACEAAQAAYAEALSAAQAALHLGTVRDLAGYDVPSGTTIVVSHQVYDAFGTMRSETAAGDFLFGLTGRPLDPATGLQNNLNRWYDPGAGRWLSEAPISFEAGDTNLHRYRANSPSVTTDPTGLFSFSQFWSDYTYYLLHPTEMDKDLQIAQNAALGVSAGAASSALVLVAAPAAANAGAWYLWGAGFSATEAATVSSGTVTAGLGILAFYGGYNQTTSSIVAYQEGDWNQLAYNTGLLVGGLLAAPGARPHLANGFPGVTKSSAPPVWRPIATFRYEIDKAYNPQLGPPNLGYFATGPTPASGAVANALTTGWWSIIPVYPSEDQR
jgi:RHS repeat-associated protein